MSSFVFQPRKCHFYKVVLYKRDLEKYDVKDKSIKSDLS